MNEKHKGPHCAGSCEGAAYPIEIRKLRAEIEALREVLKVMLDECIDDEFAPHVMDARKLLVVRNRGGA